MTKTWPLNVNQWDYVTIFLQPESKFANMGVFQRYVNTIVSRFTIEKFISSSILHPLILVYNSDPRSAILEESITLIPKRQGPPQQNSNSGRKATKRFTCCAYSSA